MTKHGYQTTHENQNISYPKFDSSFFVLQNQWMGISEDLEETHRKAYSLIDNYFETFENAYDEKKLASKTVVLIKNE